MESKRKMDFKLAFSEGGMESRMTCLLLGSIEMKCMFLHFCKTPKTYLSLQFPAEINPSDSKTPTTSIPVRTNYDYGMGIMICTVPCTKRF